MRAKFDALPSNSPSAIASEALSTSNGATPYEHIAAKRQVSPTIKARAMQDIGRLRRNFPDAVWGWREDLH